MSIQTYTLKAISCDVRAAIDCAQEYEGLPGVPARAVRAEAAEKGWRRGRSAISKGLLDMCPACVKVVASRDGGAEDSAR